MSAAAARHVYGPVPSRRLGRSLGVDLVPFKVCSYDCVYCQLGRTTTKTTERKEWVPLEDVLAELRESLAGGPQCDFVGLAGSGEPTLHSRIGEAIQAVKAMTDLPVAVLTNGSLLFREDVRRDLMEADVVMPSLDAGDERLFRWVNRPADGIAFAEMVEGIAAFAREFAGEVWLEVLLLQGVTEAPSQVAKIAGLARRISPARVHMNTVARPPAELFAESVPEARLHAIAGRFPGRVEVIVDRGVPAPELDGGDPERILLLLRRRPCTVDGIADGLGIHRTEVLKRLDGLLAAGQARRVVSNGQAFWMASEPAAANGRG